MEAKEAGAITAVVAGATPLAAISHPTKRKRASLNVLRVALFMVRRHRKGPLHAEVVKHGERGLWKTLLAAMRPLHHPQPLEQPHQAAPAPAALHQTTFPAGGGDACDSYHDVISPPSPSNSEASSSGSISVYASVNDLRALDTCGSDDEAEGDNGPHDIDIRAEEFIAKFYEQMKLQQPGKRNKGKAVEDGAW